MSTHPAPPSDTEEQEEQGFVPQDIGEDLPESAQLSIVSQFLGALALMRISKRAEVISAFARMNQTKFKYHLRYYLRDPSKFRDLIDQHNLVKNEIGKHIKREKKRDPNAPAPTSTSVGFWKFKQSIDHDVFNHRSQAITVMQAVQNKVSTDERAICIANAAKHYGLDGERTQQFAQSYEEWRKKNPTASLDTYLHDQGAKLDADQTGKELSRSDRRKIKRAVDTANQTARDQAIKANTQNGYTTRARQLINQTLDTTQPLLTTDQLKQQLEDITREPQSQMAKLEEPAPSPTLPPDELLSQSAAGTGVGSKEMEDLYSEVMGVEAAPTPPAPATAPAAQPPTTHVPAPPSTPKFSFLPSGMRNLFSNISNRIKSFTDRISSFVNKLGPAGSFLTGGLGGLAKSALSGLGSKLGGSAALNALGKQLASWLGGPVGKALLLVNDILKSLIGVDVVGLSVKAIVLVIVGVVIILPMVAFGGDLFSSGETISVLSQSDAAQTSIGWKTFEEEFFVADSWEQFEEHQLVSQENIFSQPTTRNPPAQADP